MVNEQTLDLKTNFQSLSLSRVSTSTESASPRYFSVKIQDTDSLLSQIGTQLKKKRHKEFLQNLITDNKVSKNLHVTISHKNCLRRGNRQEKEVWKEWFSLYLSLSTPGNFRPEYFQIKADIRLKSIMFNYKAMAVLLDDDIRLYDTQTGELVENLKPRLNIPHITIGAIESEDSQNKLTHFLLSDFARFEKKHKGEQKFGGKAFGHLVVVNWDNEVVLKDLPTIVNY